MKIIVISVALLLMVIAGVTYYTLSSEPKSHSFVRFDVVQNLRKLTHSENPNFLCKQLNTNQSNPRAKYSLMTIHDLTVRKYWRAQYTFSAPRTITKSAYRNEVVCEIEVGSESVKCYLSHMKIIDQN
jgi:hypothetical protein